MILPVVLYFVGKIRQNARAMNTAFAVTQAAIAGLLISSFYKIFTGRIPPPFNSQSLVDMSRQFEFGFFRDGMFWGWPSSHTTVAFAVAITLFILCRNNRVIKYGSLLVALYIGIGVSTNIHWFSEFVAGAIIGSVIGVAVGNSFIGVYLGHEKLHNSHRSGGTGDSRGALGSQRAHGESAGRHSSMHGGGEALS